jgi:hypothetical protein
MTVSKPGDFITAKCGRCNDVTGHVVMLVLDGQVAKVECKACGSVHKYREVRLPGAGGKERASVRHVRAGQEREQGRDLEPRSKSSPLRAKTASFGGAPRKSASAAKLESAWQEAMVRHNAETPLPYAMNNTYTIRDFLEHPVFGRGEVISVASPGKMDVLFQDGVKVLRCGSGDSLS